MDKCTEKDANPPKEKAVEKATEAIDHVSEAIGFIANQVFQLYSNLLLEEARRPWNKILKEQIDCTPWVDLFGIEHAEKPQKSWSSFMDCITFHLKIVFQSDAAKTQ